MVKILNAQQLRELDAYTIRHEPVASIELMERACRAFADWFVQRVDAAAPVLVVCGPGNNGGDGLGIARLLHHWGYRVKVWLVRPYAAESADCAENRQRLPAGIEQTVVTDQVPGQVPGTVIIDALFGCGLTRPLAGLYAQVVDALNESRALRVAVDVPSGLQLDVPSQGSIFKADHTVSFELPKLPFLLPQAAPFVGQWHLADIGLSKAYLDAVTATRFYVTRRAVQKRLRPRHAFDHKGVFGHALIVGGSQGKMGAAVLAARAALRTGVGLVTAHVPQCGCNLFPVALPEAMTSCDSGPDFLTGLPPAHGFGAVGIGPGLGTRPQTARVLEQALEAGPPLVLDADAINLLAGQPALLHRVPPGSLLTPHPKEFERIAGSWKTDFERLDKQLEWAHRLQSVVLVKGRYTTIATPEGNLFFNSSGNPGMATAGSGDVLTGMLTALRAQGLSVQDTALVGVYLHGLAGDKATSELGEMSVIASDLISYIPKAVMSLRH